MSHGSILYKQASKFFIYDVLDLPDVIIIKKYIFSLNTFMI